MDPVDSVELFTSEIRHCGDEYQINNHPHTGIERFSGINVTGPILIIEVKWQTN